MSRAGNETIPESVQIVNDRIRETSTSCQLAIIIFLRFQVALVSKYVDKASWSKYGSKFMHSQLPAHHKSIDRFIKCQVWKIT